LQEEFEDAKEVAVRIRKSKDRQHNGQKEKDKTHIKLGANSGALEGQAVPAPLVTPIVLQTQ
jgi:hypothetical protein